jgi:N-formylmaleamate deformylase
MSDPRETEDRGGTIRVDGARLHYSRTGSGHEPLVLLHGLTDDGACWSRVVTLLAEDFDLVVPDARGHGRSGGIGDDGFTVLRLANDVAGVLDRLDVRDALLFGHSMGAITAAVVAAIRPDLVRALVLEDPPLDVPIVPADVRRAGMLAEIMLWRGLQADVRHARARVAHPEWDRLETDPWADAKAAVHSGVIDHLGLFEGFDWRGILGRLERPGILLTGEPARGAIVTGEVAEEAMGIWQTGAVVHIPGAGHCIHRDRWSEAMEPIRSYLVRTAGPSTPA